MRGLQTPDYLYLWNPWSDGELTMATATNGTASWKRLKALAQNDKAIAGRVDLMSHRVLEELYDVKNDPDCLINLVDEADHASALTEIRGQLEKQMIKSGDPILALWKNREDEAARLAYMERVQGEADARKQKNRAKKRKGKKSKTKK